MHHTELTPQQILDLALGKHAPKFSQLPKKYPEPSRDFEDLLTGRSVQLRKVLTWVSKNLVLLQEDCPECGQTAPDDCDWCEGCEQMQCKCVCEDSN